MDRPRGRVVPPDPRLAGLSAPGRAQVEPARRIRHLHQLHLALPDARRLRRRRGLTAVTGTHADRAAHHQPPSAGHLQAAGPSGPCRQRRHHRAHRGSAVAGHRRQLGRHAAGEPALRVGPGGGPGKSGRPEAEGPRRSRRARRRRARLAGRLRIRGQRRQLGRRAAGAPRGRCGHRPAQCGRLRSGRRRGLRAAVVRADRTARRAPAPPRNRARLRDGRCRLRAAEAAAERLPPERRHQERLRGLRYAHRTAAVDQFHGQAHAVLRIVDGH